jgi:predicted  nucleic acid-binding Zn-ribbon protein
MDNGISRMMTYILVGSIAVILIIFIAFAWQGNKIPIMKSLIERQWNEQQKTIEDKHREETAVLNKRIEISENNLKIFSNKYSFLLKKIKEKTKQKADIEYPKDELEAQKRFEKLGYKVIIK